MKTNISLALNAVLLVAVGYLFYVQNKGAAATVAIPAETQAAAAQNGIVYINSDSLLKKFSYYQEVTKSFDGQRKNAENELNARAQQLQREAQSYQGRAASMTQEQLASAEQDLMIKQQNLMKRREEMAVKMSEDESKTTQELFKMITTYLEEMNKKTGYTYVLGYTSVGGGILYANNKLDITNAVVTGLNEKYPAKGKK